MRLYAALPKDRQAEGSCWATDSEGRSVFGPVRCRGEADNATAAKADNVREDPTKISGDHPYGTYLVTEVVEIPLANAHEQHSYGPFFLRLRPIEGEAKTAAEHGRTGIGIHGGTPGEGGTLRATFGCLRLDNDAIAKLAEAIRADFAAEKYVFYHAVEQRPEVRL